MGQYEKYPVKFAKQKVNYPNNTFELFIPKNWEWNVENFDNNDEIILGEKPLLILDYLLKFRDIFVSSEDLEKEVYPACSDSKNGVIRFHIHTVLGLYYLFDYSYKYSV